MPPFVLLVPLCHYWYRCAILGTIGPTIGTTVLLLVFPVYRSLYPVVPLLHHSSTSFTNSYPTSLPNPGLSVAPSKPGNYLNHMKSPQVDLLGTSPPAVKRKSKPVYVDTSFDYPLKIPGLNLPGDLARLKSTIRRPFSSKEEPIKLTLLSDNNTLNVCFAAQSPGEHLINVKKRKCHVIGSPFRMVVDAADPENPGRLSISLKQFPVRYIPRLEPECEICPEDDAFEVTAGPREIYPVGRACDVVLNVQRVVLPGDFKKLSATIRRPNRTKEQPASLFLNADNSLGKTSWVLVMAVGVMQQPQRFSLFLAMNGGKNALSFAMNTRICLL